MYRFTIDGTLYTEEGNVAGWDKFITAIKRNASSLKGLLPSQDGELIFIGLAYDYFYDMLYNQSFCSESTILIERSYNQGQDWNDFYNGIILISDIVFDEYLVTAKTKIQDNSFYARINNNKGIETALISDRSKNDLAITACPIYDLIRFIVDPTTAAYDTASPRPAFRAYDAFEYLVSFMTDGEVGFASDYLGDLTDDDTKFGGLFISNGAALRTQSFGENNLRISFNKLYEEVSKLRKLSFAVELTSGTPVLRIENEEYFFAETNLITLTNIETLTTKTKREELYSQLRIGSTLTLDALDVEFPESIQFVGWKDETYHILGQCNIDNTLDLLGEFVRASNVIEDCIENNTIDYDEEIFFIYCDNIDALIPEAYATRKNWITGAALPQYYNFELTNAECARGYLGNVPNSIVTYLGNISTAFAAYKTATEQYSDLTIPLGGLGIEPFIYPNDSVAPGTDPGNNFDVITFVYDVPAGGVYTFEMLSDFVVQGLYDGINNFRLVYFIRRYDSGGLAGGVLLDQNSSQQFAYLNGIYSQSHSATFNCSLADKILVRVEIYLEGIFTQPINQYITFQTSSYFRTSSTITGGGQYQDYDPLEYKVLQYEFKYEITPLQFSGILANPRGLITFTFRDQIKTGWIDSLKYNHLTNEAEIILISSIHAT